MKYLCGFLLAEFAMPWSKLKTISETGIIFQINYSHLSYIQDQYKIEFISVTSRKCYFQNILILVFNSSKAL